MRRAQAPCLAAVRRGGGQQLQPSLRVRLACCSHQFTAKTSGLCHPLEPSVTCLAAAAIPPPPAADALDNADQALLSQLRAAFDRLDTNADGEVLPLQGSNRAGGTVHSAVVACRQCQLGMPARALCQHLWPARPLPCSPPVCPLLAGQLSPAEFDVVLADFFGGAAGGPAPAPGPMMVRGPAVGATECLGCGRLLDAAVQCRRRVEP